MGAGALHVGDRVDRDVGAAEDVEVARHGDELVVGALVGQIGESGPGAQRPIGVDRRGVHLGHRGPGRVVAAGHIDVAVEDDRAVREQRLRQRRGEGRPAAGGRGCGDAAVGVQRALVDGAGGRAGRIETAEHVDGAVAADLGVERGGHHRRREAAGGGERGGLGPGRERERAGGGIDLIEGDCRGVGRLPARCGGAGGIAAERVDVDRRGRAGADGRHRGWEALRRCRQARGLRPDGVRHVGLRGEDEEIDRVAGAIRR